MMKQKLVVIGAGMLVWAFVVWQWNDPFTSLYTRWQQREPRVHLIHAAERATAGCQPAAVALGPAEGKRRSQRSSSEGESVGDHLLSSAVRLMSAC